jgi:hypothetical protein
VCALAECKLRHEAAPARVHVETPRMAAESLAARAILVPGLPLRFVIR